MGPVPTSSNGNSYILVVCDYFSKYSEAYPLPDMSAETVADKLSTEWISRYGAPVTLHSDQGRNFESELFHSLCELWDIHKSRTARYKPNSNGLVEKQNRTLKKMLQSYVDDNPKSWEDHLPFITMAYRASPHQSTNCSPNLLMFGEEVRLPVDLMYADGSLEEQVPACPVEYVEWVREASRQAFHKARHFLKKSAERQKRLYDKNTFLRTFKVGDWVWVLSPPVLHGKFTRSWKGPFLIVRVLNEVNYVVQENRDSRLITLHVDHIKRYWHATPANWVTDN